MARFGGPQASIVGFYKSVATVTFYEFITYSVDKVLN